MNFSRLTRPDLFSSLNKEKDVKSFKFQSKIDPVEKYVESYYPNA